MNVVSKTDVGLVRKTNQDCVKSISLGNSCLVVVCDGIGGVSGGEVASDIASSEICNFFEKNKISNLKEMMFESFEIANKKILEFASENKEFSSLGTTCVSVFTDGKIAHIANVGDSRAYIISKSNIKQITKDHSLVNELIMKGEITFEEAKNAPNKNVITRALGCMNSVPDYYDVCLEENDKILLCTDGLSNYLSDDDIYDIVSNNTPEKSLECLVNRAKSLGGSDNITVSIIF